MHRRRTLFRHRRFIRCLLPTVVARTMGTVAGLKYLSQEHTMSHRLSRDEYDALEQVSKMPKTAKPSACIARNAKHLVGIKFLGSKKDGSYVLTEKGLEALFIRNCIAGLRALASDADTKLDVAVATFLGRKGHIVTTAVLGHFEVTPKGHECLADIALNP